jgi:glycogen debranching enzyme
MHELENNYAYQFRNLPHEFHNGGLWPVWNGWLAAALYGHGEHETAAAVTDFLLQANQLNTDGEEWGFYENFHGITRQPIAVQYCTWRAAGLVIAEAYRQNRRLAV